MTDFESTAAEEGERMVDKSKRRYEIWVVVIAVLYFTAAVAHWVKAGCLVVGR